MRIIERISWFAAAVLISGLVSIACGSLASPHSDLPSERPQNAESWLNVDDDLRIPTGSELALRVKVLTGRRVRLTVTNRSSEAVFLPFWPGGKDKYAMLAIHQIERRDEVTGDFRALGAGEGQGHLSTGLHRLVPGDHYLTQEIYPENGTYRIVVYYFIDRNLVEEWERRGKRPYEEKIEDERLFSEKCDRARGRVASDPFQI